MKLLAGFITAALTTTMLSLGFAAPAQAACDDYGACIDTRVSAWAKNNPIRARQRAKFVVRFRNENGGSPNGTANITVERRKSGEVVWSGSRRLNNRKETYRTGRLGRGRYDVIVHVHTDSDRFQDAQGRFGLRVKRR